MEIKPPQNHVLRFNIRKGNLVFEQIFDWESVVYNMFKGFQTHRIKYLTDAVLALLRQFICNWG